MHLVDFLLGRIEEPVAGSVQEWIVEHQIFLKHAFEEAIRHLKAAAAYRKGRHDAHVQDLPCSS